MIIDDQQSIFTIREIFNRSFRNLKLEFYLKPDLSDGPAESYYNSSIILSNYRIQLQKGEIRISPQTKVSQLEADFQKMYGIGLVVFRKFNDRWQDAFDQRNLSLGELNQIQP